MRTAAAKLHSDEDRKTAPGEDAATGSSLPRIAAFACAGIALATLISVITAPLTLPWIVAAWIATLTVVGAAFFGNRQ